MEVIALEIIDKTNSFYSSAFSQLVAMTIGIIAFAGVFVPIVLSYYQSKKLKLEKNDLHDYLKKELNSVKDSLNEDIRLEVKKAIIIAEAKLNEEIRSVEAGLFHIQAIHFHEAGLIEAATDSAFQSATVYATSKDEMNLGRIISMLSEDCLPKITSESKIETEELDKLTKTLVSNLEKININGRYTDTIININKSVNKAKRVINSKA
ncbi:hypothetical protein [Endozoicomonas ascidiicola]|uniref:hypothetical protein n=1 Tax=Endozoicomonas ascidiicola TaxID=1698521 RepID=UPI00082C0082|nr:hypothetical protein [Endozoicomonas ascidiicola]